PGFIDIYSSGRHLYTTRRYEFRSRLVGREVLVVRARARRPRQLLGGAYDDQPVAAGELGDDRVEVPIDLLVTHHGDHLVGQRLRLPADLGDHQVALGDLEALAVREQVLHHRAERGRQRREAEQAAHRVGGGDDRVRAGLPHQRDVLLLAHGGDDPHV